MCHWDIELPVEYRYKHTQKHPTASQRDAATGDSEEKDIPTHGANIISADDDLTAVRNNYSFDQNAIVSVRAREGESQSAVYRGKVLKCIESEDEVVTALNVHQFEPYGKRSGLLARYGPARVEQHGEARVFLERQYFY